MFKQPLIFTLPAVSFCVKKTPHKVNDSIIQVDGKSGKGGKGEEGVADKLYTGESKITAVVTPYFLVGNGSI